jgi:hypothetical protein
MTQRANGVPEGKWASINNEQTAAQIVCIRLGAQQSSSDGIVV